MFLVSFWYLSGMYRVRLAFDLPAPFRRYLLELVALLAFKNATRFFADHTEVMVIFCPAPAFQHCLCLLKHVPSETPLRTGVLVFIKKYFHYSLQESWRCLSRRPFTRPPLSAIKNSLFARLVAYTETPVLRLHTADWWCSPPQSASPLQLSAPVCALLHKLMLEQVGSTRFELFRCAHDNWQPASWKRKFHHWSVAVVSAR